MMTANEICVVQESTAHVFMGLVVMAAVVGVILGIEYIFEWTIEKKNHTKR